MVKKIKTDKLKVKENREAEFFDVTGTKVLRDFLLAIHSHRY
jgi:hypothetical protein